MALSLGSYLYILSHLPSTRFPLIAYSLLTLSCFPHTRKHRCVTHGSIGSVDRARGTRRLEVMFLAECIYKTCVLGYHADDRESAQEQVQCIKEFAILFFESFCGVFELSDMQRLIGRTLIAGTLMYCLVSRFRPFGLAIFLQKAR